MSAAQATAGRVTRRAICQLHGIEFGQTYSANTQEQESMWLPPNCSQCEVELRQKIEADAEVARIEQELIEETNQRAEQDVGRDERIDAAVEADMREQVLQFVAEFYATRRADFEKYHNGQDWQRLYLEVKEERRANIFEQLRKEVQ